MPRAAVAQARTAVTVHYGDEQIEADGWEALGKKLKVPAAKKDATENALRLRVFNRLGADGWELVSKEVSTATFRGEQVWTFKRRAR